MKRSGIVALLAAAVAVLPAAAQSGLPPMSFGGAVLGHDMMWATDFAQLSQTHAFGTARSMALGGAFTSLGADLSSMSINPAGLGMYRRSEVSLTPFLSVGHSETPGTQPWLGDNRTRFSFANVGAALNVYESASGALTSLTIGVGMNRIADFNTRYSFSSESRYAGQLVPTIADLFCQQLNGMGIFPEPGDKGDPNGFLGYMNPNIWPATLAYNAYMISVRGQGDGREWVSSDRIGSKASVLHSMDVLSSGSINEFDFSLGANLNNIVYVGATIGIQSVHKKVGVTYQEEYGYFDDPGGVATGSDGQPLAEQLDYANLWQQTVLDGSGVNFKLGVIVRPVAGLRVGAAFHTPTYYSLDRSYRGAVESRVYKHATEEYGYPSDATEPIYDEGPNSWDFVSPSRLLLGASYTFGNFALVTVDYERDWYNGIRVKNVPDGSFWGSEDYKAEFKNNFKGTSTIRGGVEVKPLPILSLRVGGGYTDSMLRDGNFYVDDPYASQPVVVKSHYFTAGVGFNLGRNTVLDLAYQYLSQTQSQYRMFFSLDESQHELVTYTGLYDTSLTRHYIAMTLGFRF